MALPISHDVSGYIKTIEKTIENKTEVLMNPLKQTLQTYIKTLHAKGASKDYELASVMKKWKKWRVHMPNYNKTLH